MKYLGISGAQLHDAGMTLIDDQGNIVFASQTERFTQVKHDSRIPSGLWDLLYHPNKGETLIVTMNDDWEAREELRGGEVALTRKKFPDIFKLDCPIQNIHPSMYTQKINAKPTGHHISHAYAAFATRPKSFDKEDCVIVTIDGIGEHRSGAILDHNFNIIEEITFPKSIGYLYAAFTEGCGLGLTANEDEYVIMGLSSYGEPTHTEKTYEMFSSIPEWLIEEAIQKREEGSYMNWKHFYDLKLMYLRKIVQMLMKECKSVEDAAASLQACTTLVILEFMKKARKYGSKLCYSGGVAQNIVTNNEVSKLFDDMWVDLNPGDGGASLGAAAFSYMRDTGKDRINWEHPYLGHCIEGDLDPEMVVDHLLKERYCGVANGPAEFSYRAYGNRSLIADVRFDVKDTVNMVKRRQKYRPFAPAILEEHASDYFEGPMNRWMQYAAKAKHQYSSVTHVDGTGRVQLVPKDSKSVFRKIIECYYERTGVPMLLNTSLNIRRMPMVNTVEHAAQFERKYGVKVFTS